MLFLLFWLFFKVTQKAAELRFQVQGSRLYALRRNLRITADAGNLLNPFTGFPARGCYSKISARRALKHTSRNLRVTADAGNLLNPFTGFPAKAAILRFLPEGL